MEVTFEIMIKENRMNTPIQTIWLNIIFRKLPFFLILWDTHILYVDVKLCLSWNFITNKCPSEIIM